MVQLENLNNHNFFNDLRTKCPAEVDEFFSWYEKYLAANAVNPRITYLKFTDLPFEMQTGVIGVFIFEKMKTNSEGFKEMADKYVENIKEAFLTGFKTIHECDM